MGSKVTVQCSHRKGYTYCLVTKVYRRKVHQATWNSYCTLLVLEELNMQQESHLDEWTHNTPQPAGRGVCV